MAFGIKTLLAKEAGLDDWYCIDSFILFCIGFKYLGLNQDGGVILES
jgi:hypothetical protein